VRQVGEVHAAAVAHARAGGLAVLGGTDPVLPGMHGRNYMELVGLMGDGLDALEAWHGMTGLAARAIGRPDTGTLAAGQRADLLIATQDVLGDPARFEKGALLEVVKDGEGYRGALATLPQRAHADTVRTALRAAGPAPDERERGDGTERVQRGAARPR
jgi:imidazolonepropionase-like amidohydrolase